MLIIHRMATTTTTTLSFISNSLRLLTKPSFPFTYTLKHGHSLSPKIHVSKLISFSFYTSRSGFCCSSAVTSPESTEAVVDGYEKKLEEGGGFSEVRINLPTNESSGRLLRVRHTCAHVMAMAVQKLYPNAKVTIGPWIENGFYYDFDMDPITDKDLKRIKKEMDHIISQNLPLVREEVSRDEAQRRIMAQNEPYKLEILDSIKEEPITIYHIGKPLNLNLLPVLTGEVILRGQCYKGFMVQHGRMNNS